MPGEVNVYGDLEAIFRRVLLNDDIVLTPEISARDIEGWDSFKQIEILVSVQELFNIHLSSEEVDDLESIGDLADLIAGLIAGKITANAR